MKDNKIPASSEQLHTILNKLDNIGEDIFGKVQNMLESFEQKMLQSMAEHLDKYERKIIETTGQFKDQINKHANILEKHEIAIHTLDGKTAVVQQQVTNMTSSSTMNGKVIPTRWVIGGAVSLLFLLALDIFALVYAINSIATMTSN